MVPSLGVALGLAATTFVAPGNSKPRQSAALRGEWDHSTIEWDSRRRYVGESKTTTPVIMIVIVDDNDKKRHTNYDNNNSNSCKKHIYIYTHGDVVMWWWW